MIDFIFASKIFQNILHYSYYLVLINFERNPNDFNA